MHSAVATLTLAAALCAVLAPHAGGDVIGDGFLIIAGDAAGRKAWMRANLAWDGENWSWSTRETIELRDPSGALVAVLNPHGEETSVSYVSDPVVNLNFTAQAGSQQTTFMISSGLLTFPTIADPEGNAVVELTATDTGDNGATLTGIGDPAGAQGAYLAQYNGFAGSLGGTTFAELIHEIVAPPAMSETANAEVPPGGGFTPIGEPVNDMSVLISFTLTAFDTAAGSSVFTIQQVQPTAVEPSTWGQIKARASLSGQ